jgi:hypothetical protein
MLLAMDVLKLLTSCHLAREGGELYCTQVINPRSLSVSPVMGYVEEVAWIKYHAPGFRRPDGR